MKRYVIYQRVSTEEQVEKGYSLEAMLEKCQHYIKSQENAVLVKVYEDRGFSGTLPPTKRPALNQLLNDLKNKDVEFDTVLVWKLDRWSRSMRDTLNIEHILRRTNKTLESCTERIDTSTASGKMFFNTIASFAEFESAQIGERTWNAMSSKVGQIHLGGRAPMGYKLVRGRLKVDPSSSHVVRFIFARFLSVRNYSRVAEHLNKNGLRTSSDADWSHKKIQRILSNPVYAGTSAWGKRRRKLGNNPPHRWILKDNTHEPLVSQKVFKRVQDIMSCGHSGARTSSDEHIKNRSRLILKK